MGSMRLPRRPGGPPPKKMNSFHSASGRRLPRRPRCGLLAMTFFEEFPCGGIGDGDIAPSALLRTGVVGLWMWVLGTPRAWPGG